MNDNWVTATVMDSTFLVLLTARTEEELTIARMLDDAYRINYYDVAGQCHREDGPAIEWIKYIKYGDGVYCWHGKNFNSLASLKKWVNKQTQRQEKRRIK